MKVTRKLKEKFFKKLMKTKNPFQRIDNFGFTIDIKDYGKENEFGWSIMGGAAVHWSRIRSTQ